MESLFNFTFKELLGEFKLLSNIRNNEKFLPKLRLLVFSLAFLHLVTLAILLLSIDFSISEVQEVRAYDHLRWKLITTWFNLLMLAYFPLCIYCDWMEINGNMESTAWRSLTNIKNVVFTSILLPSTAFGDLLFWRLYNKNKYFLMPKGIEDYIPFWTQHSMHTISFVIVILDLLLTPRRRPRSLIPGLAITMTFICIYEAVVGYSWYKGEYIYPFIRILSIVKIPALGIYFLVEPCVYYVGQWLIIDFIWHRKSPKREKNIIVSH